MYATANNPAIANTTSKPGSSGVGMGVGVGAAVGVAVGAAIGVSVVVGVGVGGLNAKHAAHSGFGSHGSFGSVPFNISYISVYPSLSESRDAPPPPPPPGGAGAGGVMPFPETLSATWVSGW